MLPNVLLGVALLAAGSATGAWIQHHLSEHEPPELEWRCTIDDLRVDGRSSFIIVWLEEDREPWGKDVPLQRATCGYDLHRTRFLGPGATVGDLRPDSERLYPVGDVVILPEGDDDVPIQ